MYCKCIFVLFTLSCVIGTFHTFKNVFFNVFNQWHKSKCFVKWSKIKKYWYLTDKTRKKLVYFLQVILLFFFIHCCVGIAGKIWGVLKSICFVKWSSHRQDLFVCLMVLNVTFNNISVIWGGSRILSRLFSHFHVQL
jgi:hypothetical protein